MNTIIHATDNGVLFTNADGQIEIPAINVQVLDPEFGTYFEMSDMTTFSIEVCMNDDVESLWECGYEVHFLTKNAADLPISWTRVARTNFHLLGMIECYADASVGAEDWDQMNYDENFAKIVQLAYDLNMI